MVESSSHGEEWQFYFSTIRANIGRSTGRSILPVESSHGHFYIYSISELILADLLADLPPCRVIYVTKNGHSTFLLIELIPVDHWQISHPVESFMVNFTFRNIKADTGRSTGRSTPSRVIPSGGEFYISTIRANTCRSTGRSTPPPYNGRVMLW